MLLFDVMAHRDDVHQEPARQDEDDGKGRRRCRPGLRLTLTLYLAERWSCKDWEVKLCSLKPEVPDKRILLYLAERWS